MDACSYHVDDKIVVCSLSIHEYKAKRMSCFSLRSEHHAENNASVAFPTADPTVVSESIYVYIHAHEPTSLDEVNDYLCIM